MTYKRRALQGETFVFFLQGTLKNCISIENLTHRCKQTGQFFTKLGYFLSILKDNSGGTLPYTSWAPKLIYFLKRRWYNTNFVFVAMSKFSKTSLLTLIKSCHIGVIDKGRDRSRMWAYQSNSPRSLRLQNLWCPLKVAKLLLFFI